MKPFLRWAGGKNWLLKYLDRLIKPESFNNYHEPFVGGGSVFFHLPKVENCFLSDLNRDLICTYVQVRDNVETVIEHLKKFENTEKFYYNIRSQYFEDLTQKAAQFIYLNQTSFNGIYRVNLQGIYNVPYGHRTKDFIQEDLLRKASVKLQEVNLSCGQFDEGIERIQAGDLIFLDPPYTITHNNNGFIKYNEKLFSESDQHRLAVFIQHIVDKGAYYILTNAAHIEILNIFRINEPHKLSRASLIGGKKAKRGNYSEYLFTNIEYDFTEANRD